MLRRRVPGLKKLMTCLLVLAIITLGTWLGGSVREAQAETFTSGDFKYEINDLLSATITNYTGTDKDVIIPNKVDGYSVIALGTRAFFNMGLSSVTIPNSVTSIGGNVFESNELKSVMIPNSVTSIGLGAFYNNQLTSVTIPNSVTSIGGNVFGSNELKSVTIPNSVTSIGYGAFYGNQLSSVTIPSSVTSISEYAFTKNKLTSVTIPNSVTRIGEHAFANNELMSVIVEGDSTIIGANAFKSMLTMIAFDPSPAKAYASMSGYEFLNILSYGVSYSPNGESEGKQANSTKVTVAVPDFIKSAQTYYRWSETETVPVWSKEEWVEFTSGASMTTPPTKGTWYLHVRVDDQNVNHVVGYSCSNAFKVAVPEAPTNVTATAGNGTAKVSFDAPVSDGGNPITQYTVMSSPGGFTGTSATARPITVTGLTNDTAYTFTVVATNGVGDSAASAASASVTPVAPISVPSAPRNVTATAGNGQATVSFDAPSSNGGNAITDYTVTSSPGGYTGTSATASPITVTGLTNGTAYTFTVVAKNGIGDSASSVASSSVTPTAPIVVPSAPGTPTNVTASAGNGTAIVSFNAPASDGGSAITQYKVTSSPGGFTGTSATASPITVTGLTNGTAYSFTVVAKNGIGDSAASASSPSVTPVAPPPYVPGNGGGGSIEPIRSTNGSLTLPLGRMGEVSLDGKIFITVPANASDKELKVTIEELSVIPGLLANHEVLASSIFELLKNFSDNFSKPVTLTLTFDPNKVKDNQSVAVFYYDEAKKAWVEVPGGKIEGNKIRVEVNHFTKYAVLVIDKKSGLPIVAPSVDDSTEVNFSDIAGHWVEATIKQAVQLGIVKGYTDGSFKPNATITRSEFVTMLMNALKPTTEGTTLNFTDAQEIPAWSKQAIAQAVDGGILSGYTDGSLRPLGNITRMELATMIAKAYSAEIPSDGETGFSDDSEIPKWAKGAVFTMKQLGIVKGRGGNKFVPSGTATRAEAVTMIMNLLQAKKTE